jgi:hypothetical protein
MGLLLERPQKLFGVFIAGRRGGANGTKRGHNLRLHGTLSVGQNAPRIRIGCCIPKVCVEPTETVDRVGELIELPSHIHLQSAVPLGYPAARTLPRTEYPPGPDVKRARLAPVKEREPTVRRGARGHG